MFCDSISGASGLMSDFPVRRHSGERNEGQLAANRGRFRLTLDAITQSGIPAMRRASAHLSIVSLLRYKFGVVY